MSASAQPMTTSTVFGAIDTNRDGSISRQEFNAAFQQPSTMPQTVVTYGGGPVTYGASATASGAVPGRTIMEPIALQPGATAPAVQPMPAGAAQSSAVVYGEPLPPIQAPPVYMTPAAAATSSVYAAASGSFAGSGVFAGTAPSYGPGAPATSMAYAGASGSVAGSGIFAGTAPSAGPGGPATSMLYAAPSGQVSGSGFFSGTAPAATVGSVAVEASPAPYRLPTTTTMAPPVYITATEGGMMPFTTPMGPPAGMTATGAAYSGGMMAYEGPVEVAEVREVVKEVPKIVYETVQKVVELPQVQYREKIVEVPHVQVQEVIKQVLVPQIVETVVEVPKFEVQTVEKIVEIPQVRRVERFVEVPEVQRQEVIKQVIKQEVQEIRREVPKIHVETVERVVEIPQIQQVERTVEVPEVQVQEVIRQVIVPSVQEVIIEVPKIQVQTIEKIVSVPQVQTIEKEVPVPQIQTVYLPPTEPNVDPLPADAVAQSNALMYGASGMFTQQTSGTAPTVVETAMGPMICEPVATAAPGMTYSAPMSMGVALWGLDSTFRLCKDGEESKYYSKAMFLDKRVISSVETAVQGLNTGTIQCNEDICVVFSSSKGEWYVLYKIGKKEAAAAHFGIDAA